MAITANPLIGAYNGNDQLTYSTAAFTPAANALVLFSVAATRGGSAGPPPQPTINHGTWVLVRSIDYDVAGATQSSIFVFRSMSASPEFAQRQIDFGAITISSCAWSVVEFDGVDTSGSDGSGAIVQSVDTGAGLTDVVASVTLAALGSASNAAYGAFAHQANEATNPETSPAYTEIHDVAGASPALGFETEWVINDTTPSATWTTSAACGGIGIEVKAATAPPEFVARPVDTFLTLFARKFLTSRFRLTPPVVVGDAIPPVIPSTDVLLPQTFRGRGI
jgi:hypothetical protein